MISEAVDHPVVVVSLDVEFSVLSSPPAVVAVELLSSDLDVALVAHSKSSTVLDSESVLFGATVTLALSVVSVGTVADAAKK